jgi:3-hydroxyacyl-[acyl-carrier-protein] dehydratase
VFRGQVVPGDRLLLLSKEVEFNRRRFISKAQGVVNGKLVFEGTITGMTI